MAPGTPHVGKGQVWNLIVAKREARNAIREPENTGHVFSVPPSVRIGLPTPGVSHL